MIQQPIASTSGTQASRSDHQTDENEIMIAINPSKSGLFSSILLTVSSSMKTIRDVKAEIEKIVKKKVSEIYDLSNHTLDDDVLLSEIGKKTLKVILPDSPSSSGDSTSSYTIEEQEWVFEYFKTKFGLTERY